MCFLTKVKKTFENNSFCNIHVMVLITSIMVLFEIHQRFKGHFFNKWRVSFNNTFFEKTEAATAGASVVTRGVPLEKLFLKMS